MNDAVLKPGSEKTSRGESLWWFIVENCFSILMDLLDEKNFALYAIILLVWLGIDVPADTPGVRFIDLALGGILGAWQTKKEK